MCDTCGRHVPASLLVTSDVQGLRGADVCPFCLPGLRLNPSYLDLRLEDAVEIPDEDDPFPRGSEPYWETS